MTEPGASAGPGGQPDDPARRSRLAAFRRALLNRRALGRAVMVAAVVACVTSLIGIVVAWQLVGNLARTAESSLVIASDTLDTVDDTLDLADSVIDTVDGGIETVSESMSTIAATVENGAAALDVVAGLTEDLPGQLERIQGGLDSLESAAGVVDTVLRQLSELPVGPDYDPDTGLGASVQAVRDDLQPIAENLEDASGTLSELASSSGELIDRLEELAEDVRAVDEALGESGALLDRYRASVAEAAALATATQDTLDRDVWLSRLLIVLLGLSVAVGQIAPFRIGRELASTPTGEPEHQSG